EVCDGDQTCQYTLNDDLCPDSGDVCQPNVCTRDNDCQQITLTPVELLTNGNMDVIDNSWVEGSSFGFPLIYDENDTVPFAHTPYQLAWLGGYPGESSDLYQVVVVPPGTTSLELTFYYYIHTTVNNMQNRDTARVALLVDGDSHDFGTWANQDETTGWVEFTGSVDASA